MHSTDRPTWASLEQPRFRSRRTVLFGTGAAFLGGLGFAAAQSDDGIPRSFPEPRRSSEDRGQSREYGRTDHPGAEWIAASDANYRVADRPSDYTIDRVVVHVTQSTHPVALKVFQDPGHRAATHYVVRARDGHLTQMVSELDVAFHAGNRKWNERSIGIEHEGFVDQPDRWFTDTAYRASAKLCAGICARHGLPVDREHIVGHNEVPGTDHTDPGPHWDWDRYMRLIRVSA
ncbi:N-acetylmuramoyl-L-alanine amidase [Streptomyces fulvoviolaceus]|uniref:N-acetylmuramoyl-L-alanine amidase n=1 Tax=Streptomyces fulvoviolaceus TaxID=285535 RepID=UPI0004C69F65|nr:N-acetylmuramoyl-L-alanine amidase [Streptomyces fulvoviolaceus]